MIRVKITEDSGKIIDSDFDTVESLTEFMKKNFVTPDKLKTMEIDVESSDYNRPAFWRQE